MRTYVVPRLQAHAERFVDMICRYIPLKARAVLLAVVTVSCTVLAMRQLPRYILL